MIQELQERQESVQLPEKETGKKRQKKPRRRSARLTGVSKQRKSANTRERNRVRVVNDAFEKLRHLIPLFPTERRPSKIKTIRLASMYISLLTEMRENLNECAKTIDKACDHGGNTVGTRKLTSDYRINTLFLKHESLEYDKWCFHHFV